MSYRILILADHAWRDVPGIALIKAHLEKLMPSANILVVDIHLLKVASERFFPHLIVVNHLHDPRRNEIFDDIRRRGGLVAVMNPEGRANTNETTTVKSPVNSDFQNLATQIERAFSRVPGIRAHPTMLISRKKTKAGTTGTGLLAQARQ